MAEAQCESTHGLSGAAKMTREYSQQLIGEQIWKLLFQWVLVETHIWNQFSNMMKVATHARSPLFSFVGKKCFNTTILDP